MVEKYRQDMVRSLGPIGRRSQRQRSSATSIEITTIEVWDFYPIGPPVPTLDGIPPRKMLAFR